ncbi:hypothetical protein BS78_01G246100 [Paspalum vaginatum]|nr:hypothetical protein BS78_01G246100 [Paspalum vaginatum]
MANKRAQWTEATTKTLLDLCIAEKNVLNFNTKGLTTVGWKNLTRKFREQTGQTYDGWRLYTKLSSQKDILGSGPWIALRKKKSASIEECLRDISEAVLSKRSRKANNYDVAEHDQVRQILDGDEIPEGSELYLRALFLCKNAVNRMQFIGMRTKEGREQWIQFNWANK